jgi:hypothetical protein
MSEVGHTTVVNAHGALIALAMKVQLGEKLLVKNWVSGEEQESRVVRVGEEHGNQNLVAIELQSLCHTSGTSIFRLLIGS